MPFLIIVILIMVHEVGHFLMALLFKVHVEKIILYPFGGISKFYMDMNISRKKEFLILIMGPIFQELGYFMLINCNLFYNYIDFIKIYHYGILFFNLLPIYPLDGGKLLNIFISGITSFNRAFEITIKIGYLIIGGIVLIDINNLTLNIFIMMLFLIYKITYEYKRRKYFYEKFLLERYLKRYPFKKYKVISNMDNFYRGYRHLFKRENGYYTEREILEKKYKKR